MMKPIQQLFEKQADFYQKYRPLYPSSLYDAILEKVKNRDACWDCGTGNGQVASILADYFQQVQATDISEQQIKLASPRPNITYSVQRAEQTNFASNQFDLITVAQALHWFDYPAFFAEVRRVGKPDGMIAVWGYGLLKIEPEIDQHLLHFYKKIIGPYWNAERSYIDNHYATIPFDFEKFDLKNNFCIKEQWTLSRLEGYLNSWSSVQRYKQQNGFQNPVLPLINTLKKYWPENTPKPVQFPIFVKMGRIGK